MNMNIYREVFKCRCENGGENVVSRAVFMNIFYVFVPKQGHFWSFHTYLNIRKQKKILQTDPRKML